jgi:hypothetical protein
MGDYVWVSKAMTDSDLIRSLSTGWSDDVLFKTSIMAQRGDPVPPDMCPKRIWSTLDSRRYYEDIDNAYEYYEPLIPNLFMGGCHWTVSEKAAEIIGQFDLGGGALYPVSEGVFEFGNEIRMPGEYFTWIFGNVKQAFLPDETPKKEYLGPYPPAWWHMPWDDMADDDIAVSREALDGSDVWVDPLLSRSLFLSQRLGDALDAAGLRQDFRLFRCQVI